MEIIFAMQKHFEDMPEGSFLDEQFRKRYSAFQITVIGIYFDKTGENKQYTNLHEGLDVLKSNIGTQ